MSSLGADLERKSFEISFLGFEAGVSCDMLTSPTAGLMFRNMDGVRVRGLRLQQGGRRTSHLALKTRGEIRGCEKQGPESKTFKRSWIVRKFRLSLIVLEGIAEA